MCSDVVRVVCALVYVLGFFTAPVLLATMRSRPVGDRSDDAVDNIVGLLVGLCWPVVLVCMVLAFLWNWWYGCVVLRIYDFMCSRYAKEEEDDV